MQQMVALNKPAMSHATPSSPRWSSNDQSKWTEAANWAKENRRAHKREPAASWTQMGKQISTVWSGPLPDFSGALELPSRKAAKGKSTAGCSAGKVAPRIPDMVVLTVTFHNRVAPGLSQPGEPITERAAVPHTRQSPAAEASSCQRTR